MKDGFIKVCSATPEIGVADCEQNENNIIKLAHDANCQGAAVIVMPELCTTGYTCGDLFLQDALIKRSEMSMCKIAQNTAKLDMVMVIGTPVVVEQKLYNCAAVIYKGKILGVVPKTHIPNYAEFYELRHFHVGNQKPRQITFAHQDTLFGTDILFKAKNIPNLVLAVEICEDLWAPNSPSIRHTMAGATVIANCSASDELVGKMDYRRNLVKIQSAKLNCAYIYADAGYGESTTDLVFSGADMIAEDGTILGEAKPFESGMVVCEIDIDKLAFERRKINTFVNESDGYETVLFDMELVNTDISRYVSKTPFVPQNKEEQTARSEEILTIQAMGLKKRLQHTNAKTAVVGVSGGLDSTLALLVMVRAFDSLGLDRKQILAITMPCFGTSDRTYRNAVEFAKSLGVTLREVKISKSVLQHFEDIGHEENTLDVTYENAQARERTQVLMDISNQTNGMVIGTGDLSELALGWATYNGDHMSMYGVNASVPKTLIRYLVAYEADRTDNAVLENTLRDILDTPVSPELLPPTDGEISQKTESIVGPYELHDFFLFYMVRYGFSPKKIVRLAEYAFCGEYDKEFIVSWIKVFYRRFFTQQFKRSCVPDGVKVGSVALSPRGDWRMPSDAVAKIWIEEIEGIEV